MKLLVFAASHRKASINRKLAQSAASAAKSAQIDFAEYGDFDLPIYDDEISSPDALPKQAEQFIARLNATNGVIIASPEYNWSFPGSLKNIIDWASIVKPNPFQGKPILLLSASPSLRAGAQGLIHLRVPLEALGAHVYPRLFTLGNANTAFNEQGGLSDASLASKLAGLVEQFLDFSRKLSPH